MSPHKPSTSALSGRYSPSHPSSSLPASTASASASPLSRAPVEQPELAIDRSPDTTCIVDTQQHHFLEHTATDTAEEAQVCVETMSNRRLAESVKGEADKNTHPPPSYHHHPERPELPHRNSSFSKRHASFDTPREVPLPFMPSLPNHIPYSPSSNQPSHPFSYTNSAGQDESTSRMSALPFDSKSDTVYPGIESVTGDGSSSSDSLPSLPSSSSSGPAVSRSGSPVGVGASPYCMNVSDLSTSGSSGAFHPPQSRNGGRILPVPIWSRPFSLQDASHPGPSRIHSPTPVRPSQLPDRSSTVSLPLPSHTPFHTLPPFTGSVIQEGHEVGTTEFPSLLSSSQLPLLPQYPSSPAVARSRSVRSSSAHSDWFRENSISTPDPSVLDRSCSSASVSSAGAPQSRPIPPPAPPVVLTPPPPPSSDAHASTAPHEPFLAHAPASLDSYIAVETNPREYRLLVRLPGFRRDAITLSTRKRRILHVVADSWEPGGGHFERRISFGYDAVLTQVSANFDGEFLVVTVPRRMVL